MQNSGNEIVEKLKFALLFKGVSDDDNHNEPVVTHGTIIWGLILRSAIVVVVTIILLGQYRNNDIWYLSLFLMWLFALYPGWTQYKKYENRIKKFKENTLCGSCRNFEETSQLCKIYDQHVSSNNIPCEGMDWEPKS